VKDNLRQNRVPSRNFPAIEWPEMHPLAALLPDISQPGNPGMSGVGDLALNIKLEHQGISLRESHDLATKSIPT